MIRATRAEFGETRGVVRINEAQDLLVVLHRANETPLRRNLAAQPRQNRGKSGPAQGLCHLGRAGFALRGPSWGRCCSREALAEAAAFRKALPRPLAEASLKRV